MNQRDSVRKDADEAAQLDSDDDNWLEESLRRELDRRKALDQAVSDGVPEACWQKARCIESGTAPDLVQARSHLQVAADKEYAIAQYDLALYCQYGIGGPKDVEQSRLLLEKAAKQGHAAAQCDLGLALLNTERREQAIHWLKCAADQKHAEALFRLADQCLDQSEAPKNKSREYLQAAAQLGHIEAQYRLGDLLSKEAEFRFGNREALGWFRVAAELGHTEAQFRLGEWLYHDYEVSHFLYHEEYEYTRAENQVDPLGLEPDALSWLNRAAQRGSANAQFFLGHYLYYGERVNKTEAVSWLRKAATQDHIEAQLSLWNNFLEGTEEGLDWLKKAAENGHIEAQFKVGDYMERTLYNYQAARRWYEKAAANGHWQAAQVLLRQHRAIPAEFGIAQGKFVCKAEQIEGRPNAEEHEKQFAVRCYRDAAEGGHAEGKFRLGLLYHKGGLGISPDADAAREWLRRAAEQGHAGAVLMLAQSLVELGDAASKQGGIGKPFYYQAIEWANRLREHKLDSADSIALAILSRTIKQRLRQ